MASDSALPARPSREASSEVGLQRASLRIMLHLGLSLCSRWTRPNEDSLLATPSTKYNASGTEDGARASPNTFRNNDVRG